jgi:hypothetical protein
MRPGLRSLGERCVRYMQLRGGLLIQSARGKPGRPVDVLDDSGLVLASCGLSCKVGYPTTGPAARQSVLPPWAMIHHHAPFEGLSKLVA